MNDMPEIPNIEKLSKEALQALALALDTILNGKKTVVELKARRMNGFVLIVFPFGNKDGKCHYVSNGASRKDVIKLFKEQLRQLEGEPPVGDGKQMIDEKIVNDMSKVNAIMHELRDGKLTRDEAHRKLVEECNVADQGLDKLLDVYDPRINQ